MVDMTTEEKTKKIVKSLAFLEDIEGIDSKYTKRLSFEIPLENIEEY